MKERLHRIRQKGAEYGVTKQNVALVWMVAVVSLSLVAGVTSAQTNDTDTTDYVYVGDSSTVYKVDRSDMTVADQYAAGVEVNTITSGGGYLYVTTNDGVLKLYPGNMSLAANASTTNAARGVVVHDGSVYVGDGPDVIQYDADTLSSTDSLNIGDTVLTVAVNGTSLYVGHDTGMDKIDVSSGLGSVTESYSGSTTVDDATHLNGTVYVSTDSGIVGLRDTDLVETATKSTQNNAEGISNNGQYVYGTDGTTLMRLNSSDLSTITSSSHGGSAVAAGGDGYVYSGFTDGKQVNATDLSLVDSFTPSSSIRAIHAADASATPNQPEDGDEELTLKHDRYMEFGSTQEYTVIYKNETGRHNVTSEASVTSDNASVISFNPNFTMTATDDESVAVRVTTTANYTLPNGTVIEDTNYVAVAKPDVENLEVLPPIWRFSASFGSPTIQAILVAVLMGVFAGRIAGGFAGLGMMQLVMVAGWFIGYVSVGMAMISLFTALFIGLNMAANIDYTVTR